MIYLLSAITLGSLFAILFKLFAKKGIDTTVVITGSYLVATLVGLVIAVSQEHPQLDLSQYRPLALITGGFMAGAFITMNHATLSHGVAVATISARMSFIIPVVCSFVFFNTQQPQWIIIALVILSLLLIFYRCEPGHTTSPRQWLNPVLVFLCYGISNFMLKHLQQSVTLAGGGDIELHDITMTTFMGAFFIAMLYCIKKYEKESASTTWRELMAAITLGCVNMGCTYFLMKSLTVIDASVFYPVYNITIVTIATVVGRIFFGERLSAIQYTGIAIAIIAILQFFK